jgi:hypothetical protein
MAHRHGDEYKMAIVLPYLIGVVTAPLVAKVVKPLARGTIKTTIGIGAQAKRLVAQTVEDFQDLAAEANAEVTATKAGSWSRTGGSEAQTRRSLTSPPT